MIKAILIIRTKSIIILRWSGQIARQYWAGQNSKWQQNGPEKYQKIVWYYVCWHIVILLYCTGDEGAWWGQAAGVLARGQPRRVCDQHRGEQDWNFCNFKCKDVFFVRTEIDFPLTYIQCVFQGTMGAERLHASRGAWSRQDNCPVATFLSNSGQLLVTSSPFENLQCFYWL